MVWILKTHVKVQNFKAGLSAPPSRHGAGSSRAVSPAWPWGGAAGARRGKAQNAKSPPRRGAQSTLAAPSSASATAGGWPSSVEHKRGRKLQIWGLEVRVSNPLTLPGGGGRAAFPKSGEPPPQSTSLPAPRGCPHPATELQGDFSLL